MLKGDLEIIRSKTREAHEHGLISDGVETWKSMKSCWKTVGTTQTICQKLEEGIQDLQTNRQYWNPFLVGFYNSNKTLSKQ